MKKAAIVGLMLSLAASVWAEEKASLVQTYLGVQVTPVQPETASKLGLDPDVGLVVNFVEPGSPAEKGGVEMYDILLKLDDQILIGTRQIGVLVKSKKKGDEIVLSYVRRGERDTLRVVLDEKEQMGLRSYRFIGGPANALIEGGPHWVEAMGPGMGVGGMSIRIDGAEIEKRFEGIKERMDAAEGHPQFRNLPPIDVHRGDRMMLWRDDAAKIDVELIDGDRTVRIRGKDGEEIYTGTLNSEEDAAKIPEEFRQNLRLIEGIGATEGGGI